MPYNPKRFLDRVAQLNKAYPNDKDFPTVLASSKYPFPRETNMFKTFFHKLFKTHSVIENVLEFHEKFWCPIGETKEVPDGPHTAVLNTACATLLSLRHYLRHYAKKDGRCQRMALIVEEVAEQCKGFADRDLEAVLDSGADISYINAGSMIYCGLHEVFEEAERRVHESNLSKLDEYGNPIFDETGKVKKSHLYKPVCLSDLVKNG